MSHNTATVMFTVVDFLSKSAQMLGQCVMSAKLNGAVYLLMNILGVYAIMFSH